MKLIKPSFEILSQEPYSEGIYKMIEIAGRTCYKSEDKITEDSASKFVQMLIAKGHTAMLEHGTVYLIEVWKDTPFDVHLQSKWDYNPYTKITKIVAGNDIHRYITTNYRVLLENDWLSDLIYLCEPTEYHEKRVTVKFITDRGVSHELVRHRVFSFAQESTRYCNYSKDKFGNELTFIIPSWLDIPEGGYKYEDQNPFLTAGGTIEEYGYDDDPNVWFENGAPFKRAYVGTALDEFFKLLHNASEAYFNLLSNHTSQQARQVLPNALKTELVMTGFISDWKKVFAQRVDGITGKPHPDMLALMKPVKEEFIKRGLI